MQINPSRAPNDTSMQNYIKHESGAPYIDDILNHDRLGSSLVLILLPKTAL